MEGLIILIITFVVGSLINASKKKEQQPKNGMPPFSNPSRPNFDSPKESGKSRSLEDFAKGVFQQLSEKSIGTIEPQNSAETVQDDTAQKQMNHRPALEENRSKDRLSRSPRTNAKKDPIVDNEIGNFIPTNRQQLVQAIITSEILGPPKAKQKNG